MVKVNYVNDSGSIGGGPVNVEAARDYPNTVIVTMSPDEFLTLTPPMLDDNTEFIENAIKNGEPIAMPFLGVDIFDKDKKELVVDDHEGRHRVRAMEKLGVNSIKVILVGRCLERNPEIKQNIKSYTLYPQNYGNEWQHSDEKFQINEEAMWIGHKLALQQLRQQCRKWYGNITIAIDKLEENNDVGQYGQFCKDYVDYVPYYWYLGGRKLQPTKADCEKLICDYWDIESLDLLDDYYKYSLLHSGYISDKNLEPAKRKLNEDVNNFISQEEFENWINRLLNY